MRFVTKTRMERLEALIRSMVQGEEQSEALHLLDSIKRDIEENYAEIQRPIRLDDRKFKSFKDKKE